ncbi:MAG: type II secretion system protein [Campylobacterota bacterium]|nr:type II secretion system protein [Campylobacterota bacterium]
MKYKKSFSLIEVIFVIILISIVTSQSTFTPASNNLKHAKEKLKLYLNYTRYIAHIDNKQNLNDNEWEKKLWTLKFQNCSSSVGGLYFVVYSDTSGGTSHFKKSECLKDPLTNKYLYSNWDCEASKDESKYILLTKEYGVKKVEVSCNTNSSLGQISFGYDGKIYSTLGNNPIEITQKCFIDIYDEQNNKATLSIEPKTGYIH